MQTEGALCCNVLVCRSQEPSVCLGGWGREGFCDKSSLAAAQVTRIVSCSLSFGSFPSCPLPLCILFCLFAQQGKGIIVPHTKICKMLGLWGLEQKKDAAAASVPPFKLEFCKLYVKCIPNKKPRRCFAFWEQLLCSF